MGIKNSLLCILLILTTSNVHASWTDNVKDKFSEKYEQLKEDSKKPVLQIKTAPSDALSMITDNSNRVGREFESLRQKSEFMTYVFGTEEKRRLSDSEKFVLYKQQRRNLTDEVLGLSDISNHVYDENFIVLTEWEEILDASDEGFLHYEASILAYDKKNPPKMFLVPDWAIKADANDFQAKLYRNKVTNSYAIAYRGTQEGADWIANASHVFKIPEQYKRARHFYNYIARNVLVNQISKVKLTGHSLGGGMAQYVGSFEGNETYIFNAANLQEPTLKDSLRNSDYCHSKQTCSHIKAFRYGDDAVSLIGNGNLGQQYQIGNNEKGVISGDKLIGDHDIVNFRKFAENMDKKIAEYQVSNNDS